MKKMKTDTTQKIFAVIIAIVLWSYVMSEVNPDIPREYKSVNVEFTNTAALEKNGLIIMNPKEETINIKLKAKKSDWANFSFEDIKVQVDLAGYREGEVKVPISVSLKQPSNIKIEDFEPREIIFTFDKIITKEKTVTIKTSGELAPGYVLGDISTKSPSILLKGPRTWVNEVSEVIGDVNLEARKENINVTVPVKLIDDRENNVMGVENEPNVIEVSIPVYKTVKVPIEIQTINELSDNYQSADIDIKPSSVTLMGKESISNLKFIQTKPIDINLFIKNKTIETELELPSGVSLLNPTEKIMVSLNVEEIATRRFDYKFSEIETRNLGDNLQIDPEQIIGDTSIIIKGTKNDIENLTKENLKVYLDLDTLDKGEHKVYINFEMLKGVTVKEIKPQLINLKIIDKG